MAPDGRVGNLKADLGRLMDDLLVEVLSEPHDRKLLADRAAAKVEEYLRRRKELLGTEE